MTISRAFGSKGLGDEISHGEINDLADGPTFALDKRSSHTDTLASIVSAGGSGRIVDTYAAGADAPTTYLLSGANSIINASGITAARTYRLSNTGAVAGDRLMILNPSNYVLTVQNDAPTTIAQLGPDVLGGNDSTWADFIWNGSAWVLWRSSKPTVLAQTIFTAGGTWTCPRGVTMALLIGWGGGGGGGGASPSAATDAYTSTGGAGGGGAQLSWQVVAVTAGVGTTVTIGTGGAGGAASNRGNDGVATTFGALATFPAGGGGGSHAIAAVASVSNATYGGSPVALNSATTSNFYNGKTENTIPAAGDYVQLPAGTGGRGVSGAVAAAVDGVPSMQGFAGGAAGTWGSSGTGRGGGGGGGGGGPSGVGGAGGAGGNGNAGFAGIAGSDGTAAAANTGAGGGGGGGGGCGSSSGGAAGIGAAGGSGKLTVIPLR